MNVVVGIYSRFASWNIPAQHVERLRREFPHHTFHHARAEGEVGQYLGSTDVAFMSELRAAHLEAAPGLQWVHSPAAGVGAMLFPAMIDSAVVLTNSRGLSADTIAEHVLALTLALFRKFPLAFRGQLARRWTQNEALEGAPLRRIAGSHVLIVGLGGIGSACASRFAALGATVTAVRRRPGQPAPAGVSRVEGPDALMSLLPSADVVVLATPQTAQTRGLFAAEQFAAMRPDAVLINVSRGKVVDEGALASAVQSGQIGGAGLDVFEHEPLDAVSPLWDLPNVFITPHTAGFREDHWDAATDLFAENLRRFEAGHPLLNVVDKAAGY